MNIEVYESFSIMVFSEDMPRVYASLVVQAVKNLPAMQETPVPSLGWEDPLEKRMGAHSSILGLPWWLRL